MPHYEPRGRRARRLALMRLGIWIFLALFIASVVGIAIVTVNAR